MDACHSYNRRDQLVAARDRGTAAVLQRGQAQSSLGYLTPAKSIVKEIAASVHAAGREAAVRWARLPARCTTSAAAGAFSQVRSGAGHASSGEEGSMHYIVEVA